MKHSLNNILYLVSASVLLGGCVKKEDFDVRPEGYTHAIGIAETVEADTKAGSVSPDDELQGVHFLKMDAASCPASFAGASLHTGTRTGGTGLGTIDFDDPAPRYAWSGMHAYLAGYWPGVNATQVTDGVSASWELDGKTDVMTVDVWDAGTYTAPQYGHHGYEADLPPCALAVGCGVPCRE